MTEQEHRLDPIIRELGFEIPLLPGKRTKKIHSFDQFEAFVGHEVSYWQNFREDRLVEIHRQFEVAAAKLKEAGRTPEPSQQTARLKETVSLLGNTALVFSESPFGAHIQRMKGIAMKAASAAYDFHRARIEPGNINNPHYVTGLVCTVIRERGPRISQLKPDSERDAYEKLSAEIQKTHDETTARFRQAEEQALELIDATKADLDTFSKDTKESLTKHLGSKKEELDKIQADWQKRMDETNTLYRETIRLKKPAEYWDKLCTDYEKKGRTWMRWAGALLALIAVPVAAIIYSPPAWILDQKVVLSASGIKLTILTAVVVSLLVYFFHLFVKLSMSAYHLSRDAKERYQLTHVYLSLIDEKAVEPSEREIVLQSLFSRADTGLLKGDSSPTLPGTIGSLISNITGK